MILIDVTIKDFLSFRDAYFQFPHSGLVLLTGWDDDLGRANGAGKSSFMQAVTWCLYGELPREVKVEELIRRGQLSCSVTVNFDVDGTVYTVTRKRPLGLDVFVGGQKQKGNPKFLQAFIDSTIGLSYKQFLITSFFPQKGDSSRFLKQTDAMAKDFLSTVLNFNKTEQAYKKIHIELKELEIKAASQATEVKSLHDSIERFEAISAVAIPAMPDKALVTSVKKELDLVSAQTLKEPDTSELDFNITKVQQAISSIAVKAAELEVTKRSIADKKRRLAHLADAQQHSLECPKCAAELIESNGRLVEFDTDSAEQVKQSKVSALETEIAELEARESKDTPVVARLPEFETRLETLRDKRSALRHDFNMANQKKHYLGEQIKSFKEAILASQQAKKQKDDITAQIVALKASLVDKVTELKTTEDDVMLLSAAKAVLSPTGAIAYSLDGIMSDLNDEVGKYLDIFSHNTMTYKITSGDDKAKVSHIVSKGGADVSVGSLSGGEERGLIFSVDLGLSEVIVSRSGVNLPSILMLDESTDGLDYIGKEKVLDALREIAKDRCIIVIDHSTEMSALFDASIKVVKKNDVSTLEVS